MFDNISNPPIPSDFLYPIIPNRQRNRDVEMGGVWVNNTSQALTYQGWLFFVEDGIIKCKPFSESRVYNIVSVGSTNDIAGTFDRNMNPCVAYKLGNLSYYYYFDTNTLTYVKMPIENCRSFALTHDDKRQMSSGISDIILTWITDDNKLYYSLQRERYLIKHEILTEEPINSDDEIMTFGMNRVNRLQWDIGNSRNRNPINYT